MRILVFQNYPIEDAAMAGEAFRDLGHELRLIDCFGGDPAPAFAEGDAALVLGGPMNVYEEERYPFLRWETNWMRRWIGEGRPLLGLCLGAQLISKAMGGARHEKSCAGDRALRGRIDRRRRPRSDLCRVRPARPGGPVAWRHVHNPSGRRPACPLGAV